jgi:hypothetical protein
MARKKTRKKKREVPVWDRENLRLYFRRTLIKRYRRLAPLHWRILDTFQEEEWPEFVFDPLLPLKGAEQSPHKRLRGVVAMLNRALKGSGIRFESDNGGDRVRWSATDI